MTAGFFRANRGIVLDLVVFFLNVLLIRALVNVAGHVLRAAQEDVAAKIAVGLFFAGLLFLQPVGPLLKRWSFHQRSSFSTDSDAGCLLFYFMFVYLVMMMVLSGAATVLIGEVIFKNSAHPELGVAGIFPAFGWSVVSVFVVYRYFVKPKHPPRWTFLTTPAAERLGDVCMYANVIGFQILWSTITASAMFREAVTGTPLGRAGSFTDVLGRLIAISVLAALVYFPGRIFYLVEDKHRKLTWLTMLLANLPLILRTAFAAPFRP